MAEIANTLWYRLGTVTVTDGSTKVTGVGTHWTTAGINPGATFRVDGKFLAHEVKRVVSDTEIELGAPYYGGSASGAAYSIDRNFQSTTNAKLAADVTDLVALYEQVRDGTMPMIEGKSAYQVAVANGYVGTEAQWLESLKGAGEITAINNKLSRIYINNAGAHNSLYRGKNLGTSITAAQIANIKNGSFDDIYVGDYWVFSIDGSTVYAYVAGCDLYFQLGSFNLWDHHIVLWCQFTKDYNINDTATLEGGFAGSKLYTQTFPYLISELEKVIPAANFKTLYDFIPDAFNTDGTPSHMVEDRNMKMFLPTIFNVSGFMGRSIYNFAGTVHWPLAMLNPPSVNRWYGYWLGSAASSTMWHIRSLQSMTGAQSHAVNGASEVFGKCWPYILVG